MGCVQGRPDRAGRATRGPQLGEESLPRGGDVAGRGFVPPPSCLPPLSPAPLLLVVVVRSWTRRATAPSGSAASAPSRVV